MSTVVYAIIKLSWPNKGDATSIAADLRTLGFGAEDKTPNLVVANYDDAVSGDAYDLFCMNLGDVSARYPHCSFTVAMLADEDMPLTFSLIAGATSPAEPALYSLAIGATGASGEVPGGSI